MRCSKSFLFVCAVLIGLVFAESRCTAQDILLLDSGRPVAVPVVRVGPFGRIARNREAVRGNRQLNAFGAIGEFRSIQSISRLVVPSRAIDSNRSSSIFVGPRNGGRILIINNR